MKALVLILVLLLVSGCEFAGRVLEPNELIVSNLDGPPVTLILNGEGLARLVCQFRADGEYSMVLDQGDADLPWSVTLIEDNGVVFGTWEIDQLDGTQRLLIRNGGGILGDFVSGGPVPVSNPGCPEAGLDES